MKRFPPIFMLMLVVSFSVHTCGNREKSDTYSELIFEIDSTLVGPEIKLEEFNLAVSPPAGWTALDLNLQDSLKAVVLSRLSGGEGFLIDPLEIIWEPKTSSILSISRIELREDSVQIKDYYSVMEQTFTDQSLNKGYFKSRELPFTQYLIQGNSQVAFKLITHTDENAYIQFDYVIPLNHYMDRLKAIESSIGSIHKLD
jgi:hypothetical protein